MTMITTTPTITELQTASRALANPFAMIATFLRAYEDLRKFRRQSHAHLEDAGISGAQAGQMTLRDFMAQPRR